MNSTIRTPEQAYSRYKVQHLLLTKLTKIL